MRGACRLISAPGEEIQPAFLANFGAPPDPERFQTLIVGDAAAVGTAAARRSTVQRGDEATQSWQASRSSRGFTFGFVQEHLYLFCRAVGEDDVHRAACCCMLTRERTATVSCNLRQPRRCGACMSCSAVAVAPKEHARSLAVRYSRAQRDAQLADLRAPTPLRSGDRHAATPPAIFRGAPRCCSGRGMRVSLCLWRRSVRLLRA